ncbi:uncharacterized protein LOC113879939 isoform X1 [Bos indicus x Bos taurus]|uniref:uncharacterized protein LOC113879939 isoform X1 n=1 Tax=Bos indicus x Bos taurus TaxID=30522 RepID=UPI000F7D14E7|nr:uncharacterized protein LOC113879939 isoform X1 [Bos indicus x Bos taurus]XP_027377606.1 uncharacterized protein LOC113879939 isoform X1 [Bos indicus x Bos taurus]XP_027377607.1 uncharacterized protein LOC113879939 isoform X1 [Bos indicus x Bos taurus]XP_027377608.1 uncharacterized protein LOC113879939 isoform X1 [Bos indicus x Bos taurus]XP_027377609.1 uncharacterized protein LOC113879939 isoform X1 [Bos indicus x Bos taurus]XP_027377610.1 uncharacterized protein LOC113879939 isoform X1 [B
MSRSPPAGSSVGGLPSVPNSGCPGAGASQPRVGRSGPRTPPPSPWHPQSPFQGLATFSIVLRCTLCILAKKKKKMAFAWCVVERVFSPPALPPPCPSLGLFVLIISNPRDSLVLCSLFFSVLVGFVHLSVVCLCLSINPRIKVPLDFSIPVWDIKKKIKKNWIPNQCPEREEPSWLDPGFVAGSAGSPGGGVWWRRGWSVAWWAGLRAGYPARSDFGPWVGTGSGRGGVARGGVGGSSPAQRCPRVLRCQVAGRRRSRSHGYRQGAGREPGGPGATSALLARALSGRRRPLGDGGSRVTCQELPFPASSAMCPGHVSRALWA